MPVGESSIEMRVVPSCRFLPLRRCLGKFANADSFTLSDHVCDVTRGTLTDEGPGGVKSWEQREAIPVAAEQLVSRGLVNRITVAVRLQNVHYDRTVSDDVATPARGCGNSSWRPPDCHSSPTWSKISKRRCGASQSLRARSCGTPMSPTHSSP